MMKQPIPVQQLQIPDHIRQRYQIPSAPWNELFQNGVPRNCSFMLTAEPGAGKTTFMLDFARVMSNLNKKALFITTEQSVYDIKMTCERLGINNIDLMEASTLHDIIDVITRYNVVILDSFACLQYNDANVEVKNRDLTKLRKILDATKDKECVFVMIQHITKGGTYKGSTYLAHMVDVVMHMEITDSVGRLFNVQKNRYGVCKEYEMIMTTGGLVTGASERMDVPTPKKVEKVIDSEVPSGYTRIECNVYGNSKGHFQLMTQHGMKYVHADRMEKLLQRHGTYADIIENYRTRG
jgi:predicted ATP-dependent serine protease